MRNQAPHCHALAFVDREIYRTFDALPLQAVEVLADKTDGLWGVNGGMVVHSLERYPGPLGQGNTYGGVLPAAGCYHERRLVVL